jgi:hypothetical protein
MDEPRRYARDMVFTLYLRAVPVLGRYLGDSELYAGVAELSLGREYEILW